MKKLILLFALIATTLNAFGTNPIEDIIIGKKFVIAESGLKMRVKPNFESPTIKVIKLGESLNVVEDTVCYSTFNVGWVEGTWLKVEHEGRLGYVFDGYLTNHTIIDPFEFGENYSLGNSLRNWALYNFPVTEKEDTVFNDTSVERKQVFSNGNTLYNVSGFDYDFTEIVLEETSVMEAYLIVKSLIVGHNNKETFGSSSVFVRSSSQSINLIKVSSPMNIKIEKLGDNKVKVSVREFLEGC